MTEEHGEVQSVNISNSVPAARGPTPDFKVNSFTCTIIGGQVMHVEAIAGAWIAFAPFAPCLLWALFVRGQWLRTRSTSAGEDAGNKTKAD